MTHVVLRPDGQVTLLRNDGSECDVSDSASEYLFYNVLFAEGLTLRDVFMVLKRNPVLVQIYRQHFAEALLQEAFSAQPPLPPPPGPEEIEYLELSRYCFVDHSTRTYDSTQFLMLIGVGFALQEPLETEYEVLPVGHRQRWNVASCSARDLSINPIRFDQEVDLPAPALKSVKRKTASWKTGRVKFGPPTLGQVIHGVLHELSFFGVGKARDEFQERIAEERIAGNWEEISVNDHLAQLDEMIRKAKGH